MTSPVAAGGRVARRVAGAGALTLALAGRLRRISARTPAEAAPRARAAALQRACRRVLALHGLEVRVEGPLPEGPALLAANHVSWLDPLAIASLLPCVPISKLDVSGWPVMGRLARDAGVIFVRRGDPRSGAAVLRAAAAALAGGLPVLNFPEGTTTTGTVVLPFRRGLFGLARRTGAPVVPVAVRCEPAALAWVGDDTFLPHYLRLAAAPRGRLLVTFGEAIPASAHANPELLARAARQEIADRIGAPHATAVRA